MAYDDEAHQTCRRAPDQIQATIAQSDVVFAIDGAGGWGGAGVFMSKFFEADLFSVNPWPAPSTMLGRGHRPVSDGVALGASYKLMPIGERSEERRVGSEC